jgi:MerR family copper efflux transcriptional regulator
MLISELARQAGLTPDTIRFYEKRGLLDSRHMERRDNNYKDYRLAALERLHHISHAKCAGFTLNEIVQMFREWDTLGEEERRELFADKIQQIDRRMAEMEKIKAYLSATMPACIVKKTRCGS